MHASHRQDDPKLRLAARSCGRKPHLRRQNEIKGNPIASIEFFLCFN
jgi:hypothetical protein